MVITGCMPFSKQSTITPTFTADSALQVDNFSPSQTDCESSAQPTSQSTITPTSTADPALQVDNFSSLQTACESIENMVIKLTKDITATEDLKILSPNHQKREVTLDLNGYTLCFENKKIMYVDDVDVNGEDIKPQVTFTLTSGQNGGSVIFMYKPEEDVPGCIDNSGNFILDNNVMITARNSIAMSSPVQAEQWSYQYSALITTSGSESLVTINSGTINAPGNYRQAIYADSDGQVVINGGVIQAEGDDSIAIYNWGGKVHVNGGEIKTSGNGCVAISNEDTFNPLGNDVVRIPSLSVSPDIVPDRDTFVMSGGVVSATGKDSIAVTLEKNCTITDGTISATGENSVGIAYYYVGGGNKEEKLNVNLLGGQITGESHAMIDYRGNKAFYKNAKGKIVNVDSTVKKINASQ